MHTLTPSKLVTIIHLFHHPGQCHSDLYHLQQGAERKIYFIEKSCCFKIYRGTTLSCCVSLEETINKIFMFLISARKHLTIVHVLNIEIFLFTSPSFPSQGSVFSMLAILVSLRGIGAPLPYDKSL